DRDGRARHSVRAAFREFQSARRGLRALPARWGFRYLTSISKYRLLAAANFQFVAIGVFEKERVVTGAIALANLGSLELFSAGFAHELCNPIHFLPRISPKRDAC